MPVAQASIRFNGKRTLHHEEAIRCPRGSSRAGSRRRPLLLPVQAHGSRLHRAGHVRLLQAGQGCWADTGKTYLVPESPAQYLNVHYLEFKEDGESDGESDSESDGEEQGRKDGKAEAKQESKEDGKFYSRYPPGLSVMVGTAYKIGEKVSPGNGWKYGLWVDPVLASLTVLFLFLLARAWVGNWMGLLCAGVYAVNAEANFQATAQFAHTATAAFLVLGMFFLDQWARRKNGWLKVPSAFIAGLLLGALPTIATPRVWWASAWPSSFSTTSCRTTAARWPGGPVELRCWVRCCRWVAWPGATTHAFGSMWSTATP